MAHPARRPIRHTLGAGILLLAVLPAATWAGDGPQPRQEAAGSAPAGGVPSTGAGEADLPRRLDAIALHGARLRENGELDAALAVLERGHDEMLRQDRDLAGLQVYLAGLGLQAEYAMTLVQLGRVSVGDEVIATARRAVDLAYARRNLEPAEEGASAQLVAASLQGGERLETALADFHAERLGKALPEREALAARERMVEAYRRAETWVLRQAMGDGGGGTSRPPAQRVAALRLALARGLLAAGSPHEAAAEFVAAAALSCTPDAGLGHRSCQQATLEWAQATGAIGAGDKATAQRSRWTHAMGFDAAGSGSPPDP